MLTPYAAGKALVLLTFGMLGWYLSMAVGSTTMRQGLFRERSSVFVLPPDLHAQKNSTDWMPTGGAEAGGVGVFVDASQTTEESVASSEETGRAWTGDGTNSRTRSFARHASKVSRRAGPTRTFSADPPQRNKKGSQSGSSLSQRPVSCPPLEESLSSDAPPQTYPSRDRGDCSCTPVVPFILLSMQRSGSGWVETLLNSHPNIKSHGEVFQVRTKEEKWEDVHAKLDGVFNLERVKDEGECLSAVGFKWMLNQGALQYRRELAEYARERGLSVILLLRRNTLRRLISVLANIYDKGKKLVDGKEHRSHVHSVEEANKLAHFRPHLTAATLLPELRHVRKSADAAIALLKDTRHIVVYYEDVVADATVVDELQAFLGVPPRLLHSKQVQIHRQSLQQHIANWDEVKSTLSGTEFEHMLQ